MLPGAEMPQKFCGSRRSSLLVVGILSSVCCLLGHLVNIGWMGGWMDGRVDEWMGGQMDCGWVDG